MNMGLENMSFEPDEEEVYQRQTTDLVDDRRRAEKRNSDQTNESHENSEYVKDNGENSEKLSSLVEEALALQKLVEEGNDPKKSENASEVEENIPSGTKTRYDTTFTVTERPHPATSPEGIEWQKKDTELKSDLYGKNEAWTTNPTQRNYQAYIESYDTLARHNTAAWHNDVLTKEGVYSQYSTNTQKPTIDKVERSILMSGNLYFNQAKPNKITDQELEDIAKTLMWERLKNPAVVDFEFAQGFRVNLWVMREETRKLLEEKVRELGGNNYNHLPHAETIEQHPTPPTNTAVAPETNIGQAENSQEAVETNEQGPEEETGPENEGTRYARILKGIRKNGVANEQDREEWAETINHLLELNNPEKARELAQERINGADRLSWEGNNNDKMVNALILAAAIRKREEMQKDAKSQEDQELFLKEYLKNLLGQEADEREVAEFLKQTTELKNVHA